MNSPPLMPIRRWIFHTARFIPTCCIVDRQASTCWYTESIRVPSRSNRNDGVLRASMVTPGSSLNYRTRVITTEGLSARLREIDDIGVGPEGVYRLAWTDEDAATRGWFERQAAAVGLRVLCDPAGNLWACPPADAPWWGIGSHLDSVRGGGRFDGPLGVACGFEVAAALAGAAPPVAVVSFADEEGARFNTPTFGSKALSGRLDLPGVLSRRDDAGVALGDAMRGGRGGSRAESRARRAGSSSSQASSRFTSTRRPILRARARRSGWCGRSPRGRGSRWCCAGGPTTPGPRPATSAATRCRRPRDWSSAPRTSPICRSLAHGHDLSDRGQAERADDDRRRGAAVDRRAGARWVRRDRRVACRRG